MLKRGIQGIEFSGLMASIQQGPNGPVLVLKESALQQKGKDAQQNNIAGSKTSC